MLKSLSVKLKRFSLRPYFIFKSPQHRYQLTSQSKFQDKLSHLLSNMTQKNAPRLSRKALPAVWLAGFCHQYLARKERKKMRLACLRISFHFYAIFFTLTPKFNLTDKFCREIKMMRICFHPGVLSEIWPKWHFYWLISNQIVNLEAEIPIGLLACLLLVILWAWS